MAEPFSLALGVLAVVQTAAATAQKLYEFGKTVHGAKDEIRSLNKKANSLHVVLQFIDDAFQDPKFQTYLAEHPAAEKRFANLRLPLNDCMESMEKLLDVLRKNTTEEGSSGARRAINSVKWFYVKDDVIAIRDELSDTRDSCTFAFTGMNMMISIESRIAQIERDTGPDGSQSVSPAPPPYSPTSEYQYNGAGLRKAALEGGHVQAKEILAAGVPVDSKDEHGRTALSFAAEHGYIKIVRLLIEAEANVNVQCVEFEKGSRHRGEESKRASLHWAAAKGHTEVVKALLEAGANIEARTANRRTPVLEASVNNHFGITKYLIEQDADINAHTYWGWGMLHQACSYGQTELVELLLAHHVDVEAAYRGRFKDSPTDQRPLHYAVKTSHLPKPERTKIIELLVVQGNAQISAQDSSGATAIHEAVKRDRKAALEILLKRAKPADLAIRDKSGQTALDYACARGINELVEMIRSAQDKDQSPG